MSKFEQLLDLIVNEERAKADELFHEIVVEMSRGIYEQMLAEEESEFPIQDKTDDLEHDAIDHGFDDHAHGDEVGDEFGDDEFGDDEFGDEDGDEFGDDEFGDETDHAPATKDDIHDLENSLEELKAAFEKMMAGDHDSDDEDETDDFGGDEDGEDESEDDDYADSEEEEDEDEDEADDEDARNAFESRKSQGETMREYIEKVTATMDGGLVGARTGETMSAPKEGKSPIGSGSGKPSTGANSKNIAQNTKGDDQDGTKPYGKIGGVVKSGGQFVSAGTKNVAASASTKKPDGTKLSNVSKPSNKEFAGVGAKTGGDKAGQTGSGDTTSPLNGAPNRAK
jgi:hypothetical protein